MVATNILLTIGFTVVSNFTQVVDVPRQAVPSKVEDLQKYVVGGPGRPVHLYLQHRSGTRFLIDNGVVYGFSSNDSYKESYDQGPISRFQGTPTFTSNQVLELALRIMQKLDKSGNSIARIAPVMKIPGASNDKVPFYWITWPKTNSGGHGDFVAFMEVDARTGLVTCLDLRDTSFFDLALASQISNQVYIPEPSTPSQWDLQFEAPLHDVMPHPSTNQVLGAIGSWLRLCSGLGVDAGSETNLSDVFWPRTILYTNYEISPLALVCQVRFKNHACFESINGLAFSHYASDSCFAGFWQDMTREQRDRFKGRVVKHWEDLARDLERVLVGRIGIPKELLAPFSADTEINRPEFGTETTKRVVLGWRNWPRNAGRVVLVEETTLAFEAEFDVETGELKWITFHDPRFIAALGKAQLSTNNSQKSGQ